MNETQLIPHLGKDFVATDSQLHFLNVQRDLREVFDRYGIKYYCFFCVEQNPDSDRGMKFYGSTPDNKMASATLMELIGHIQLIIQRGMEQE